MNNIKFIEERGFVKSFTGFVSENEAVINIVAGGKAGCSDVIYIYINKENGAVEYVGETKKTAIERSTTDHWTPYNSCVKGGMVNSSKTWVTKWRDVMVGVSFDIYVKEAGEMEIIEGEPKISTRKVEEVAYINKFWNRINREWKNKQ